MLPIDDADWLEDFKINLAEDQTASLASDVGETLVLAGSKPVAVAWLTAVGAAGAAFSGPLAGAMISSRWTSVIGYVAAFTIGWWTLRGITGWLAGPGARWQGVVLFFFTYLLGAAAIGGASMSSRWWAYGISCGGGAFLGMIYGSLDPTPIRRREAWMAALPLGPLATGLATYLYRHTQEHSLTTAAFSGAAAGALFALPMMILLVTLWENARGLRHLAILYLHHPKFLERSADHLSKAIALAPDAELFSLRGLAFSRLGQTAAADADWRHAREIDRTDVRPDVFRGDEQLRRGEIAAAIATLESAVLAAPKNGAAHASLGLALARNHEELRALEHYDRAIELEPRRPSTAAHRAHLLLGAGRLDEAVRDCKRALDIYPDFDAAYVLRGHAFVRLGKFAEAAEDYEMALEVAVDPGVAAEAERGLAAIADKR